MTNLRVPSPLLPQSSMISEQLKELIFTFSSKFQEVRSCGLMMGQSCIYSLAQVDKHRPWVQTQQHFQQNSSESFKG